MIRQITNYGCALLLVFSMGCQGKPGQSVKERSQSTVSLGEITVVDDNMLSYETLNVSPGNKLVGYFEKDGKKQKAIVINTIDGKKKVGKAYQSLAILLFSPDNKRFMYGARIGKKWCMVIDGKQGPLYKSVAGPAFSPDGKKALYIAEVPGGYRLVVNGRIGAIYSKIWPPIFSKDGKRMAYVVSKGKKKVVYIDGKKSASYSEVSLPVFSEDGKRVAYRAELGEKRFIVLDGKKQKTYGLVGDPVFSKDGTKVAYKAVVGADDVVIVNKQQGPGFFGVAKDSLVFSADGNRIAYVVEQKKKFHVVVDDKPGEAFHGIEKDSLTFSPDGKRLGYIATFEDQRIKNKFYKVAIIDNQPGELYEKIEKITFSPDSTFSYYVGENDSKASYVVNGKVKKTYNFASVPDYSSNGSKHNYVARKGRDLFVVAEGKCHNTYRDIYPAEYSKDSELLFYVATAVGDDGNKEQFVVVNGHEDKKFNDIVNGNVVDQGGNLLSYIALKKNENEKYELIAVEDALTLK